MTAIKNILYWLIANTYGGYNRGLILDEIFKKPDNAYSLSTKLDIDYKTMRYHLDLLIKNGLVEAVGSRYGRTYFISDELKKNKEFFYKIWTEFKKKKNK